MDMSSPCKPAVLTVPLRFVAATIAIAPVSAVVAAVVVALCPALQLLLLLLLLLLVGVDITPARWDILIFKLELGFEFVRKWPGLE